MESTRARLWLVRHGETDWNVQGRVQGHTRTDLNENGRQQARDVATFFQGKNIGSVWSSDLPRAVTTAEIIAQVFELKVQQTEGLRERSFGKFEGMTFPELSAARKELGLKQLGDLTDWNGMPGVETNQMLGDRVIRVLKRILEQTEGQDAVVVTHGGVIARTLYQVLEIAEDRPRRFPLANGMVAVLEWGKDAFYLLGLFDVGMVQGKPSAVDTSKVARTN